MVNGVQDPNKRQRTGASDVDVYTDNATTLSSFSRMYTDPTLRELSDVKFIIDSVPFPAHRVVVAAASPVFKAMLTNGMRETISNEISIEWNDQMSWELALRFIYTGSIELRNREISFNVLRLAHQYQMTGLLSITERYFCKHILANNVFSLYALSDEYGLKELKKGCDRILMAEFMTLSKKDEFKQLSFENIDGILGNNSFVLSSEIEMFHAIRFWANIPFEGDGYDKGTSSEPKIEEGKMLLRNLKAEKMQPWEIEEAWKYPFVRDCAGLVDAFMKRTLVLSSMSENPRLPKFTIIFKIAENKTPSGSWDYDDALYSTWRTDDSTGKKWCLQVYLQGLGEAIKEHVSLYLELKSGSPMSTAKQKFQLFLLKKKSNGTLYSKNFDHQFKEGDMTAGCKKFIEKRSVYGEGSEYISEEPRSLTFGVNLL